LLSRTASEHQPLRNSSSLDKTVETEATPHRGSSLRLRRLTLPALAVGAWVAVLAILPSLARWLCDSLLRLPPGRSLSVAVSFFLYETPKVLLLLVGVVFAVGIVRSFFTAARTRRILSRHGESTGNLLASLLGVATPFCSCSAVPLFIGFVTAGVPLGVTFSFLISAPMVNEVALVLLLGLFGWRVAALYLGTGLAIAMAAGWVIGRLHLERHIEPWVFDVRTSDAVERGAPSTWDDRLSFARSTVREIVGKVWPYVVGGIAVGAAIHGWVPTNFLASLMGKSAWWAVPVAVLAGVPMYSNAAGIIPIVEALLGKGAALGTVLAFMMAVIGLSLPETLILRKVLRTRLIAVFIGIVAAGILVVGYLFNAVF
jgi:uncharacterized protein